MKFIEPLTIRDTGAFSRASIAAYYARSGLLSFAPVNQPRLNHPPEVRIYAPAGWLAGPSLLLPSAPLPGMTIVPAPAPEFLAEGAATNLMLQSQDLSTWTAAEATVSVNTAVAPDGTASADFIAPSAVETAGHKVSKMASGAVAAGARVGCSLYVRAAGVSQVLLRCAPAGEAAGFEVLFDFNTGDLPYAGAFGTGAELQQARVSVLAAGWHRLELEGAVAGATVYGAHLYLGDGATEFEGVAGTGVGAWGAQIELGGVTSYIATAGAAATRAADVGTPLLVSSVDESEPVYNTATPYAKDFVVRGNTAATAHTIFVSVQAANLNKPLTDRAWWIEAGPTNRWRMFDEALGTQTSDADAVSVVINPLTRTNAVALMAIDAAWARITVTDPVEGVVEDRVESLVDNAGINDPWNWFFQPIRRATYKVFQDLPPYAGVQVTVTLADPGYSVLCGAAVIGTAHKIGNTQWGASLGIIDSSTKQRDDFGRVTIRERAFSRQGNFDLWVEPGYFDRLYDLLGKYRARLLVWIGSDQFSSMVLYGFYRNFRQVVPYPTLAACTLELEAVA